MELQVSREELNAGGSLPPFYEEDVLVLLPRDPYWLHAYWEISSATLQWLVEEWKREEWDSSVRQIRVYRHLWEKEGEIETFFDVELPPTAGNWYLEVSQPDYYYHVEFGWKKNDGKFYSLLSSNTVRTPRDRISSIIDENWTLPDWKFRRLYRRISLFNISSPELIREHPHFSRRKNQDLRNKMKGPAV